MTLSRSLLHPSPRVAWFRARGVMLVMIVASALFGAGMLVALETPSQPFLQKNGFYLESAGFRAKFANDAAGAKALRALPAHRFVVHNTANGPRYLYADPKMCVCIFVGNRDSYLAYQDILRRPLPQADYVSPDYKSQAGALLSDDPIPADGIDWQPDSMAEYFRDYY